MSAPPHHIARTTLALFVAMGLLGCAESLAQYVRSILAVNSRWDVAFAQVSRPPGAPPNFQAPLDAGETRVFRAPSLKNVAQGARFMHDGRFTTLEEVAEFYNSGIQNAPSLDARLKMPGGTPLRLNLSVSDKAELVAFLRTLNDQSVGTDARFTDPFRR